MTRSTFHLWSNAEGRTLEGNKIVDEFWHSDLASDPDNQNKAQVPVFAGFDERGRRLYDMHERRVCNGNLNLLLGKFRRSDYGARFRAATRTAKRPNGAALGRRQFAQARCACVKKRKASQCDWVGGAAA